MTSIHTLVCVEGIDWKRHGVGTIICSERAIIIAVILTHPQLILSDVSRQNHTSYNTCKT